VPAHSRAHSCVRVGRAAYGRAGWAHSWTPLSFTSGRGEGGPPRRADNLASSRLRCCAQLSWTALSAPLFAAGCRRRGAALGCCVCAASDRPGAASKPTTNPPALHLRRSRLTRWSARSRSLLARIPGVAFLAAGSSCLPKMEEVRAADGCG